METEGARVDSFHLPEEMWAQLEVLLPKPRARKRKKGGRPRLDPRRVADGIFYILRTGMQWKALPREFGSGSSVHRYFQQWQQAGGFEQFWAIGLLHYDARKTIRWTWQSMDGAMGKAPLGGKKTGPNPTDRAKQGTKRSVLVDGAGVPLGLAIDGANVHDKWLVEPTLASIPIERPEPSAAEPQHLCLDKGYDYTDTRALVALNGYIGHIKARGEEVTLKRSKRVKARRWVVERTHSWFNRFRRILIRWEKKPQNYLAMLHLACAYLAYRLAGVLG